MIFFFDIPEILDNSKLSTLPKPEAQLNIQSIQYLQRVE